MTAQAQMAVRAALVLLLGLASVRGWAQPLPNPTHPLDFGYYQIDGRFGDSSSEVACYTPNLYVSQARLGYECDAQDGDDLWLPWMRDGLCRAGTEGKDIFLTLNLQEEQPGRVTPIDDVLEAARPVWNRVKYIEIAERPEWTQAQTENKLAFVRNKLASFNLPLPPAGLGITYQSTVPGLSHIADTPGIFASLDWVGIQAHVPAGISRAALVEKMQLWTGRVMGLTTKKMVLQAMAYAPGAWINDVGTLITLQTVPYEFAWDNERVLAITLFRYGGARGTREIWQLQEAHMQMGEAILGGPLPGGCVPTPRPPRETTCLPYDYLPPECWKAQLSIQGGASVVEGDDGSRNMRFTVRLASFATVDVSVDVIADGGTATPGVDYEPLHERVTIHSRDLSQTVNVRIYGDTLDEPNETVVVRLAHADGALIHDDHATGTILDDDPPAISIGDAVVVEGSGGVRHLSFPIMLSSPSDAPVSVDVATGGGTATPGVDYEPRSQRVTIPIHTTSVDFPVPVYTDTCDEPDETVHVGLSNPAGASIQDGHAVGTIQDDDSMPSLSISGVSRAEGDQGTSNAVFTVSLSSPISCEVRVRARTSDGSAAAPGDYAAVDQPVVFPPGETSRTVEVPVVGDETSEPDETFFVDLSEPIAATIAVGRATGTILNDESPWKNVGTADFDKDGDVDILWRHDTGQLAVWFMDGTTFASGTFTDPPELSDLAWRVRGTGDFNGDGRVDILWRHEGSGQLAVWFMDGVKMTSGALIDTSDLPDLAWRVRGTGDFDADGQVDILWQHEGSGQVAVWFMDGVTRDGGTLTTPPDPGDPSWVVNGTGDFNGDGRVDILFRHRQAGQLVVWYMEGTTMTSGTFTTPPALDDLRWKLVGTGDFNGDGKVDIVWRHNQAGENVVWLMDGVVLQSGVVMKSVY